MIITETINNYINTGKNIPILRNIDCSYGVSLYKGVLIEWDRDYDTRIFTFVDRLLNKYEFTGYKLLTAHESEGTSRLLWENKIPDLTEADVTIDWDVWCVTSDSLNPVT